MPAHSRTRRKQKSGKPAQKKAGMAFTQKSSKGIRPRRYPDAKGMKWQQHLKEHGSLDAAASKAMAKDYGMDHKELAKMSLEELKKIILYK